MSSRPVVAGVLGAAASIAVVTVVARVAGFGRWLVFAGAVGDSCLGTAYQTANMLPNIVFEVVAGGALAGAVVPLVAGQLASGRVEDVRRTVSALLTWSLLVLVPLAVLGALLAGPAMSALLGDVDGCADPGGVRDVAARMFVVFAPQVPLYGLAVVCSGVLNAHRRYVAAAVAPLVSTAVVVSTYAAFWAAFEGSRADPAGVPGELRLLLSAGTTAGVLVLAAAVVAPVLALRLGLRPTLSFPPGAGRRARALAAAGLVGLVAQQLATLVVVRTANAGGGGLLPVYGYTWAVFLLPYAVLAVPLATSAFTAVSEQAARGDTTALARTTATTTRVVLLAGGLGAAALAGAAVPVARTFLRLGEGGGVPVWGMSWALVAFAPGLLGYGVLALHSRVLYATGAGRTAGLLVGGGWVLVGVTTALLALVVPRLWTVVAVGAAHTAGLLAAGTLLAVAVGRRVGGGALDGVPRGTAVTVAAAGAGALAGAALARTLPDAGAVASAGQALLCGAVAALVHLTIAVPASGADVRARVRGLAGRAAGTGPDQGGTA